MDYYESFLSTVFQISKVPFDVISEDGNSLFSCGVLDGKDECTKFPVDISYCRANVYVPEEFNKCIPLLKYLIQDRCKELLSNREQLLISVFDGNHVNEAILLKELPFLKENATLFVIDVEGSKEDAVNVIREMYRNEDIVCFSFKDVVLLLGNFEDEKEHAESIREGISSNLYCKCSIIFGRIKNSGEIYKVYDKCILAIKVKKNFMLKTDILRYEDIMFEEIVMNIHDKLKQEIYYKFKEYFDSCDKEMKSTIYEFINSGLNISEAARKLYVHRNTLIYRLDKILKDTGFDIRNFKEAAIFMVGFLIWTENSK